MLTLHDTFVVFASYRLTLNQIYPRHGKLFYVSLRRVIMSWEIHILYNDWADLKRNYKPTYFDLMIYCYKKLVWTSCGLAEEWRVKSYQRLFFLFCWHFLNASLALTLSEFPQIKTWEQCVTVWDQNRTNKRLNNITLIFVMCYVHIAPYQLEMKVVVKHPVMQL